MPLNPRNVTQTDDGIAFLFEAQGSVEGMILSHLAILLDFEIYRSPDGGNRPCIAVHLTSDGFNELDDPEVLFPGDMEWA